MGHVRLFFGIRSHVEETELSIQYGAFKLNLDFQFCFLELLQSSRSSLLNGMLYIDSRPAQLLPPTPLTQVNTDHKFLSVLSVGIPK